MALICCEVLFKKKEKKKSSENISGNAGKVGSNFMIKMKVLKNKHVKRNFQ